MINNIDYLHIVKGAKDILPNNIYKWHFIEQEIRKTTKLYNIQEIRTPTFEYTNVFLTGIDETSDIVNKEMYTFLDRGNRSITLKPEGTASVARAFVDNSLFNNQMPQKLYYITPCFRYERPQAGRLREFHQFGVEYFGCYQPSIDAELILLAEQFLTNLNINNYTLYINNIGCTKCKEFYHNAIVTYMQQYKDCLCDLCKLRLEKNPLRILDCKNNECKQIANNAPSVLKYICEECKEHFNLFQTYLNNNNVNYIINDKIVRGLDYYTKTVFEFVVNIDNDEITICGGGRYDNLLNNFGVKNIPGVGFGIGIERLLLLIDKLNINIDNDNSIDVFIANIGKNAYEKSLFIANKLRQNNIKVDLEHMNRQLNTQLKYANKINAKYVIVIGENELLNNKVYIKNMKTRQEQEINIEDIFNFVFN